MSNAQSYNLDEEWLPLNNEEIVTQDYFALLLYNDNPSLFLQPPLTPAFFPQAEVVVTAQLSETTYPVCSPSVTAPTMFGYSLQNHYQMPVDNSNNNRHLPPQNTVYRQVSLFPTEVDALSNTRTTSSRSTHVRCEERHRKVKRVPTSPTESKRQRLHSQSDNTSSASAPSSFTSPQPHLPPSSHRSTHRKQDACGEFRKIFNSFVEADKDISSDWQNFQALHACPKDKHPCIRTYLAFCDDREQRYSKEDKFAILRHDNKWRRLGTRTECNCASFSMYTVEQH